MATKIYLIRHGRTKWRQEDGFAGISDISLSDSGYRQAYLPARRIFKRKDRIDAVYSSPLKRSCETARKGKHNEIFKRRSGSNDIVWL